jgi:hypothetical protein
MVGHSSGAMMGAVAISIDDRFQAAVFEAGLLGMGAILPPAPARGLKASEKSWALNLRSILK